MNAVGDVSPVSVLCRVCLQIAENAVGLFSETKESKDVLEKLYLCFQIILSHEIYYPNLICSKCTEELYEANRFRHKCVTFEERFATYCKQISDFKRNEDPPTVILNTEEFSDITSEPENKSESIIKSPKTEYISSKEVTSNQKNTFVCDICSKILKTKATLLKHIISMHQKRKHVGKITGTGAKRRYHCTKCLYVTPHSQTLVNHMRRHDGERPYRCECGKSFSQSSSLAAHQKTHSSTTYYTCATCGKQFKHAFTLKNHQRVHEAGGFSCDICQKLLKSGQSLQVHMRRHYNERNFNCEDCGATFVACSDLLNHKKKHSTEKSAECHLCGYKTGAKKNLIMHLKRHTRDRAFKCPQCTASLYSSSELRRHMRVHSREKPFPCPACAQRFAHSPSLNKHVRRVHAMHYTWADHKAKHTQQPLKHES